MTTPRYGWGGFYSRYEGENSQKFLKRVCSEDRQQNRPSHERIEEEKGTKEKEKREVQANQKRSVSRAKRTKSLNTKREAGNQDNLWPKWLGDEGGGWLGEGKLKRFWDGVGDKYWEEPGSSVAGRAWWPTFDLLTGISVNHLSWIPLGPNSQYEQGRKETLISYPLFSLSHRLFYWIFDCTTCCELHCVTEGTYPSAKWSHLVVKCRQCNICYVFFTYPCPLFFILSPDRANHQYSSSLGRSEEHRTHSCPRWELGSH